MSELRDEEMNAEKIITVKYATKIVIEEKVIF